MSGLSIGTVFLLTLINWGINFENNGISDNPIAESFKVSILFTIVPLFPFMVVGLGILFYMKKLPLMKLLYLPFIVLFYLFCVFFNYLGYFGIISPNFTSSFEGHVLVSVYCSLLVPFLSTMCTYCLYICFTKEKKIEQAEIELSV